MKILLYRISSKFETSEEEISEFEDGSIDWMLSNLKNREKRLKKNNQSQRPMKQHQAYQLQNGSPIKRGKRNRSRKIIEDIMAEDLSNS